LIFILGNDLEKMDNYVCNQIRRVLLTSCLIGRDSENQNIKGEISFYCGLFYSLVIFSQKREIFDNKKR